MKVLVTGRSGSGKSTVCHELQQQGFVAFDGDKVPGLARWVDANTHERIEVDYSQPIDRTRVLWYWNQAVLREVLATHDDIFLCGSADNDLELRGLFDKVFALTLDSETQRQRILSRAEHDYGKLSEMQEQIITEQQAFIREALRHGVIMINAEREPSTVAREIIRLTYEYADLA